MTREGDRSRRGVVEGPNRRTFVRAAGAGVAGLGGLGTVAAETESTEELSAGTCRSKPLQVTPDSGVVLSGEISEVPDEQIDAHVESTDEEVPFSRTVEDVAAPDSVVPPCADPNDPIGLYWGAAVDFDETDDGEEMPTWTTFELTVELAETGENILVDGPVSGVVVPALVSFETHPHQGPVPGYETTFDASSTGGEVDEYQWEFGDGTTVETSDPVVTHTYEEVGTYEFELTVVRPDGETQTVVETFELPETWVVIDDDPGPFELPREQDVTLTGVTSLDADEQFDIVIISDVGEGTPFVREISDIPVEETEAGEPNEWAFTADFHVTQDGVAIQPGTSFSMDVSPDPDDSPISTLSGVVALPEGLGGVSGLLTRPDGFFSDVDIEFYDEGELVETVTTLESGRYVLNLPPGTYEATLADPRVGPSSTELTVEEGEETQPDIQPRPPTLPGQQPPEQAAAFPDGLFENVTGDGTFDILDVQALFDNLDSSAVQNGAWAYNFSGVRPDEVTIFDVQALFTRLQNTE